MSLHPILALEHVIEEYRDYLRTEFRAKDPALKAALDKELDRPLFLSQEPFYQAHRPFMEGRRWRDLPIDPRLAKAVEKRSRSAHAYFHQSEAIAHLLSPEASSVVVTTGTGSGKSEAFLVPVIQNAVEDAEKYKRPGLTAILVYPMNALANDQLLRIQEYLNDSGFNYVTAEKYDRGTNQAKREELRKNPPHILLTNYMMLEYLLVRPADREDIFANHRCRFIALDEVHAYRGTLGSNIALLVRRIRAHLRRARQDWYADVPAADRSRRYPTLIPVGTSATIKSISEGQYSHEETIRLREEAVQQFFSKLTGATAKSIRVFGEELQQVQTPLAAKYPARPVDLATFRIDDDESLRRALCALAGLSSSCTIEEASLHCALLWDLNRWMTGAPLPVSQLVAKVKAEVAARQDASDAQVQKEVEAALVIGAALPDGTPGALRLRAHRLVRGGWRFHRCVKPSCGKLYPMGEDRCSSCGHQTAPLHLCRNCGADYLRFVGEPLVRPLRPSAVGADDPEWMLYEPGRFEEEGADDEGDEEDDAPGRDRGSRGKKPTQMKKRPVLEGSFDVSTLRFSDDPTQYPLRVMLAPARNRCLCCGGTAGSRNVVSPVALGTSAAVKVLSEGLVDALADANRDRVDHDGKERLLVFSDSRQDAAHQARFIIFASRYDRMRRRVVQLLANNGPLSIQRIIELLGETGIKERDNPYAPVDDDSWIPDEQRKKIQAYEEAPILDEISLNAGYRATLVNLGLVRVVYHQLDEYVAKRGGSLASRLGITIVQLEHLCRCLLDEMRIRGCLSREMLSYHPQYPSCPDYMRAARWERRVKKPQGYPMSSTGRALAYLDETEIPYGIARHNAWRKPKSGGKSPRFERIIEHLLNRFGGAKPTAEDAIELLELLRSPGRFIVANPLFGIRDKTSLLQVEAEAIRLHLVSAADRVRCNVCSVPLSGTPVGAPCSRCHGRFVPWSDEDVNDNRTVRRIRAASTVPLVAGEHTAQVPNDDRVELEDKFKAPASESKVNLLACSPTLEMGIDVGGLDAVILRNVPPRPDNYAQRGGRAGRRSRVGLVVTYARSTPHDQYFFDKPAEMIAGEVPAPALALENTDVLLRHLNAIAFGAAEAGLAGRMMEYVSPKGEVKQEAVDALIKSVSAQFGHAVEIARDAWGTEILGPSSLGAASTAEYMIQESLDSLPARIQDVFNRTARQVQELRKPLERYSEELRDKRSGGRSGDLITRLLGLPADRPDAKKDADDRSAGYPLRRFAEFGILPGYEFPTEPTSLRLLGDEREEDPLTVARRFGLDQFRPEAQVYARTKRWKVVGLDSSSPWNPSGEGPSWTYRLCRSCGLRFLAEQPRCPRCRDDKPGQAIPAAEFAGFLATRDESPILDEEDRFATNNQVRMYPQWDGDVAGRWAIGPGWTLRWSCGEEVRWLNEGKPRGDEAANGAPILHREAKGYLICGSCGRLLTPPQPVNATAKGGRRKARSAEDDDQGHADNCPQRGTPSKSLALVTSGKTEILRLVLPIPQAVEPHKLDSWGITLGYALRAGMRHLYMLDGPEVEFEYEGTWHTFTGSTRHGLLALSFIDPSLGGSGYLRRIAETFHLVARRAIDHLDHPGCQTSCYRCLKSYQNQRFHELLVWPLVYPALEALAAGPPEMRRAHSNDIEDPTPWLEAYAAGVGSPLELKFLRLFEQHGLQVEKQYRISDPVVTVADFAVPAARLAIYVDSAAFHVGETLRRDRFIRIELKKLGWAFEELRAGDLVRGADLVELLRQKIDQLRTMEPTAPTELLGIDEEERLREFLANLEAAKAQPRKALRIIFSVVDQALLDGRFAFCDNLLDNVDPTRLDATTATGFLAITVQARGKLHRRDAYVRRLEAWLQQTRPDDVERLLSGLR